jgi:hypothetical protein
MPSLWVAICRFEAANLRVELAKISDQLFGKLDPDSLQGAGRDERFEAFDGIRAVISDAHPSSDQVA